MCQLVIEIDTPEDEALLLQLLPKLNGRVVNRENSQQQKDALVQLATEIAAKGGVGDSFGDPSEWQREIRSWDRVLDGREE